MTTEFTMILFVLIGLIIGFVAGRSTSRAGDAAKLQKELTKTKKETDQFKRDVQDHFATLNSMMESMKNQQQRLLKHIEEQQEKLLPDAGIYHVPADVPSEDKDEDDATPVTASPLQQPLDYSGQPSGLLNDKK